MRTCRADEAGSAVCDFGGLSLADHKGAVSAVVGVEFDGGAVPAGVVAAAEAGVDLFLAELSSAVAPNGQEGRLLKVGVCVHLNY